MSGLLPLYTSSGLAETRCMFLLKKQIVRHDSVVSLVACNVLFETRPTSWMTRHSQTRINCIKTRHSQTSINCTKTGITTRYTHYGGNLDIVHYQDTSIIDIIVVQLSKKKIEIIYYIELIQFCKESLWLQTC